MKSADRAVVLSVVPTEVLKAVTALLAIVGILSLLYCSHNDMIRIWTASAGESPAENQAFTCLATALARLAGGFVAASFGVKLPSGSLLTKDVQGLVAFSYLGLRFIGSAYPIIYVVLSRGAAVTWVSRFSEATAPIKNLTLTSLAYS